LSKLEESHSNAVGLTAVEKIVYGIGYGCGILFFGMTRGLKLPSGTEILLVAVGLVCLIVAFILGFKANKR
ncbi:hypothetical protein, partial [Aquiflexum sp.]|uniref:hypothetical protein n=1 Tax=Aquiflexum sp. TaxID=1872584 RepID=UPI003594378C